MNVYLAGAVNRQLEELLQGGGLRTTPCSIDDLSRFATQAEFQADVVVLDVRGLASVPANVTLLKRHHPLTGVVIVAASLDPVLMLEAMRAGVSEFVTDPVTLSGLKAAIDRVVAARPAPEPGQVFAFVGGKGGVGTTTLAVNVAVSLAGRLESSTLLIDLHVAHGDAGMFLGIEPRFSVADALEQVHRLDETFLRSLVGRTKFALDLLGSSDRAMVGPLDVRAIRALIDCAARHYSHVILDVPRSDFTVLDALELVTKIIVVANQELATIRGASRIAAALRQRYGKDRVAVVVSRYDQLAEIGPKEIERCMGGPIAEVFPSNYRVALGALNVGRPLVLDNHSKLAASFGSFARGLVKKSNVETAVPERPARLLGRFGRGT